MIRSFYHHGAEVPATDLNRDQMRAALADAGGVLWVDMSDARPKDVEEILTGVFEFHPLTISECLQGVRRPKTDDYGSYLFFVIYADDQSTPVEDVNTVELDVYLGPNFVVTHHPLPLPAIDQIVNRATQDESLMAHGADSLVYEILRTVASDYGRTVDFLSAAVAGVEVEVLTAPAGNTLRRMHQLNNDLLRVRRVLVPLQDVVDRLAAHELKPIDAGNRPYFRELAARFARMIETTDTLSESIRSALQTHLSVVSSQTSRLLRLVAALVTILLPLTALAVLYNTSFSPVSALGLPYADTAVLGGTLLIATVLALYIYHRGWQ
ncbi:MAG: magnesium transporter CorA family protein [Anaerolineae bacterium]